MGEELEKQFADTEVRWEQEREAYNDNLGGDLFKLEGEKANREHQISVYNDELHRQEGIIYKYTKEKKHMQEVNAHNAGEIGGIEERYDHLFKIKEKLGETYAELGLAY